MHIKRVTDVEFKKYGQVLKNYDFKEIIKKMKETPLPSGTIIEIFATMLYYASCNSDDNGFRCAVVLPRDINIPL